MTKEEIDKKLQKWIDNVGEDVLRKATQEAKVAIEQMEKFRKIDYLTLLEPIGI